MTGKAMIALGEDLDAVVSAIESAGGDVTSRCERSHLVGFNGDESVLAQVSSDPAVASAGEDDSEGFALGIVVRESPVAQLNRLSQRHLPLDGTYRYIEDGEGTLVYILDTGCRGTHVQFEGRMEEGVDTTRDPYGPGNVLDPGMTGSNQNHGTYVAGAAAAELRGVAHKATIVPVMGWTSRTDPPPAGTNLSMFVEACEWIADDYEGREEPGVVNVSLNFVAANEPTQQAYTNALITLLEADLVVVLASGNSGEDDPDNFLWPQKVAHLHPGAINVGSVQSDDSYTETSNRGPTVPIYVRGHLVATTGGTTDGATTNQSGTSMSAPIVAGLCALIRQRYPEMNAQEVIEELIKRSTKGIITNLPEGSLNRMASSAWMTYEAPTIRPSVSNGHPMSIGSI